MKVSLSWLNDYVPVEMDVNRLADALTMVGLEVEGVEDRWRCLESVVVGRVLEVKPHPDADKLTLCRVDVGGRTAPIVCGAPNVVADMLTPVALPGAVLPDGLVIKKSKIRGQVSEGMMCSEVELELGSDASGLLVLDPSLTPGQKLAEALELSDWVLEISITPNRPDCLSLLGVAREVAAIQGSGLKLPDRSLPEGEGDIHAEASVSIEAPDLCPRYAARLLTDITIGPSPAWLQRRLLSVGQRPISNIVDVTNFVLMETGQPLHAFDFDEVAESRIVVRPAKEGEPFTTLDEKKRVLSENMLMICDGQKAVAVGGVMGGMNSEIEDATTRVLIESACFNPISVRKTGKALGLSTEASFRFERGVDPGGTVDALDRAARLMLEVGGGRLISGLIDEHPGKSPAKEISLSIRKTNRLLGLGLSRDDARSLLESVAFTAVPADDPDLLTVTVPSFRVDVTLPEDLMEEVARLSGYDNIPTTFPAMTQSGGEPSGMLTARNRIKALMAGFGFFEAINYSFIHAEFADRLALSPDDPRREVVALLNPLSEDQSVMRTSTIPGLLESMGRNTARGVKNLKLFEIGNIFMARGKEELPQEIEMLAGLMTGDRAERSWSAKPTPADFYDLKGVVEALLKSLNIDDARFSAISGKTDARYTRPGHAARIEIETSPGERRAIGLLGEVHPRVLENFGLKQTAFIFEIDLNKLVPRIPDVKRSR
ncbi:MAG: phenylalanine--tRNA ligase subunit beta, partial [Desulfobacterales bacterium]|nr:phenylalanine--tRNA ligase subunit beta [Desulfobacterales bacterium]